MKKRWRLQSNFLPSNTISNVRYAITKFSISKLKILSNTFLFYYWNNLQSNDTKLYKQTTKVEKLLLKLQRYNCNLSFLRKCRDTILKVLVKIPIPFLQLFPLCFASDLISLVTYAWRLTSSMFRKFSTFATISRTSFWDTVFAVITSTICNTDSETQINTSPQIYLLFFFCQISSPNSN